MPSRLALATLAGLLVPCLAAAEPVTLKFAYPGAANSSVVTDGIAPWAKKVEAASHGTLAIKVFAGGSIGTYRNIYDRTLNGVTDMATGCSASSQASSRRPT